jgi:NAD(P)H-hydrate epimerase
VTPEDIAPLFAPRSRDSNKGTFGHALIVAGSRGKSGAAAMAGLAALRTGAGLVTLVCPESVADVGSFNQIVKLAENRSLVAIGPGIGTESATAETVKKLFADLHKPMVVDADALNCIAGTDWHGSGQLRVLTPHPGEMARLTGRSVSEIQGDRISAARDLATSRSVIVVLKGERTLIAFPDGRVWINPTGSPAMAKGGTGDILTGMIAGLLAQFPHDAERAIAGAVYLHGLAGEIAARNLTEQTVIATDLLHWVSRGIHEITDVPNPV